MTGRRVHLRLVAAGERGVHALPEVDGLLSFLTGTPATAVPHPAWSEPAARWLIGWGEGRDRVHDLAADLIAAVREGRSTPLASALATADRQVAS